MKKLFVIALLVMSANAQASVMWILVNSEVVGGTWFCTYQAQGTNYTTTIQSRTFCQSAIWQ